MVQVAPVSAQLLAEFFGQAASVHHDLYHDGTSWEEFVGNIHRIGLQVEPYIGDKCIDEWYEFPGEAAKYLIAQCMADTLKVNAATAHLCDLFDTMR